MNGRVTAMSMKSDSQGTFSVYEEGVVTRSA
jgi:hypothetical protein